MRIALMFMQESRAVLVGEVASKLAVEVIIFVEREHALSEWASMCVVHVHDVVFVFTTEVAGLGRSAPRKRIAPVPLC